MIGKIAANYGTMRSAAKAAGYKGMAMGVRRRGARVGAHVGRHPYRYGAAAGAVGAYSMWQPGSNAFNRGRRPTGGMVGNSSGGSGMSQPRSMGGYA